MGNKLREAVFARLRPHLRIHGNRREGFYFSTRTGDDSRASWWDFCREGALLVEWDSGSARAAGFHLYGDAELRLWHFAGRRAWEDFVAEAILNFYLNYDEGPWSRLHFAPRRPLTWPSLIHRCAEVKRFTAVFGDRKPPSFDGGLALVDDGNSLVCLLRTPSGPLIYEFYTS
jgi:hypothetical protein